MLDHVAKSAENWQLILGLAVVLVAVVLIARAALRRREDETVEEQRNRRGRLTEDLLTVTVATIAAVLSAHALMGYAQTTLQLTGVWRLLPFGALDAAAVVCAVRARRRARAHVSAGVNGALVWVFACVSSVFSAGGAAGPHHPLTVWGAVGHGVWALVAATLWHIGLAEERRDASPHLDRRVDWIRWLHPVERVQVLAELAADTSISADVATVRVRQQRTARSLFTLNVAALALARAEARPDSAGGVARERRRAERRVLAAERRAQRAAVRVRLAEDATHAAVMPQLRVLVDVREIAVSGGRLAPTGADATAADATGGVPSSTVGAPTAGGAPIPPLPVAPAPSAPTAPAPIPVGTSPGSTAPSVPVAPTVPAPAVPVAPAPAVPTAPVPWPAPSAPTAPAPSAFLPGAPTPVLTGAGAPASALGSPPPVTGAVTVPTAATHGSGGGLPPAVPTSRSGPGPNTPLPPVAAPSAFPSGTPAQAGVGVPEARQGNEAGAGRPRQGPVSAQSPSGGTGVPQSSGSAALQSAAIPQQGPAAAQTASALDPRALTILEWLQVEPTLTGADAARRLNVPVRTGQRLWAAARTELARRASSAPRRLRSVGETTNASTPTG